MAGTPLPQRKWYAVILVIISVALYANTFYNSYAVDDMAVITHNTYVAKGVAAIPEILSTPSLRGFSERPVYDTTATNDIYRPVSLIMFAVERQVSGDAPTIGHFMNVVIFACCVVLLFLFIDRIFGYSKTGIAFVAALLFAVHPIHTEVVANIKSRDELLCFFFGFSALLLFHKYTQKNNFLLLLAGAGCYFLSLLSKETSICFIVLVPVVFFVYSPGNKKGSILISLSSIIAAAVYLSIRYYVLSTHNANHSQLMDFMENPLTGAPSTSSRIATAILVMGHYVRLLFIPYPLCSDYTFASIPFADFSNAGVWLSVAIYVALGIVGIYRLVMKRADVYALGILFFLFSIAIFTNIAFLTGAIMAERFLFFPSVGFCLVIASLLWYVSARFGNVRSIWLMVVPVAIVYAGLTRSRNAEWKDNYTLARADVQKHPQNARLWHSLGYVLATSTAAEATSATGKNDALQEGIECMHKSLSIYPPQTKVHTDIGNAFMQMGRYDSAEKHMLLALAVKPGDPVLMSALGGVFFAQHKYGQTLALCRRALLKAPNNLAIMNNTALCYLQLAQYDSAAYFSQRVLQREPDNVMAGNTLAAASKHLGKGTN